MKKNLLTAVLIFFAFSAFAQQRYYVSVVKGKVLGANNKPIKVGSKLGLEDAVSFPDKNSMLVLMDPKRGRVVAHPANVKGEESLIGVLGKFLELEPTTVRLSSGMGVSHNVPKPPPPPPAPKP